MLNSDQNGNVTIFSPITYSTILETLCTPQHGWYHNMLLFLEKCDALFVLQLDGWENSTGVQLEIAYALGKDIPITYLNPEQITLKE